MIENCPVCRTSAPMDVLELPTPVPVLANRLYASSDEAKSAPVGATRLVFCTACGHLWNAAFDPAIVRYDEGYENSLHFSAVFSSFAAKLAERLVERFDLRGKTLVEIGSGQGDFLRDLCRRGGNRGIGFDPSYAPVGNDDPDVSFTQSLFPAETARIDADFVYARHVLEHLDDPLGVLAGVRRGLGDQDCSIYVEVPDGSHLVSGPAVWDLVYEHPSHFTASSLSWLLNECGYGVDHVGTSFGGQFLFAEGGTQSTRRDCGGPPDELIQACQRFGECVSSALEMWGEYLARSHARGETVVAWGAGSKGTTFLNLVPEAQVAVGAIVDLNERKHERFVPGSGHQVVSPGAVAALNPDIVLVMNPLYASEVEELLLAEGVAAAVVPVVAGATRPGSPSGLTEPRTFHRSSIPRIDP